MSILVNRETRVLVQGITGHEGRLHAKKMLEYGTRVVAGVTPGKGGESIEGVPVFDTVGAAIKGAGGVDAAILFVPAGRALDALTESIEAGIKTLVCITEGVPVHDLMKVKATARERGSIIIGPNTPGIIVPNECKMGIMPQDIFMKGHLGVVSRSGTLTYEAVHQLTREGVGQSVCMGIGGDAVTGLSFSDILMLLEKDEDTGAVLMIGEIGGTGEEDASVFIKRIGKPVFAYIAGLSAPPGRRMGHAGAMISEGKGRAEGKIRALEEAGARVIKNPARIGREIAEGIRDIRHHTGIK